MDEEIILTLNDPRVGKPSQMNVTRVALSTATW